MELLGGAWDAQSFTSIRSMQQKSSYPKVYIDLHRMEMRDGSAVKSTGNSSSRHGFDSQHLHDNSQPSINSSVRESDALIRPP